MMSNNLLEVKDLSVNVEIFLNMDDISTVDNTPEVVEYLVKGRLMCLWDLTVQVNLHSDTL